MRGEAGLGGASVDATGPSRRRGVVVALIVIVVLGVGVATWYRTAYNAYPCNGSKGVGYGPAVDRSAPTRAGSPTPEDALRGLASSGAPRMGSEPIPKDGWVEYDGRWVHDMPDGSFYEVKVRHTETGWEAGDYKLCRR